MFQLLLLGKRLITVLPLAVSSAWGSASPGLSKSVSVSPVTASWAAAAPQTVKTRSVADVPATVWAAGVPSTVKTVKPGIVSTDSDWTAGAPGTAKERSVLSTVSAWSSVAPVLSKERSTTTISSVWSSGSIGSAKTVNMPLVSTTEAGWVAAVPTTAKGVNIGDPPASVWSPIPTVLLTKTVGMPFLADGWFAFTPTTQKKTTMRAPGYGSVLVWRPDNEQNYPPTHYKTARPAAATLSWSVEEEALQRTYHFDAAVADWSSPGIGAAKTVHMPFPTLHGRLFWTVPAQPTYKSLPTASIPVANWSAVAPTPVKTVNMHGRGAGWSAAAPSTAKTVNMPLVSTTTADWEAVAPTTTKTVSMPLVSTTTIEWTVGIPALKKQTRNLLPVLASWSIPISNTSRAVNPDAVTASWSAVAVTTQKTVYPDPLATGDNPWPFPGWIVLGLHSPKAIKTVRPPASQLNWSVGQIPETIRTSPAPVTLTWIAVNAPVWPDSVSVNWTAVAPEIPRTVRPEAVSANWSAPAVSLSKNVNAAPLVAVWQTPAPAPVLLVHAKLASVNWTTAAPVHSKTVRPDPSAAYWSDFRSPNDPTVIKTRSTTPPLADWSVVAPETDAPKHAYPAPAVSAWSAVEPQVELPDVIYPASVIINWSVESPTTGKLRSVSSVPSAAWSVPVPNPVLPGEEDSSAFLLFVGW